MPLFAADEDFNNRIIRGIQRKDLTLDIVRIQDLELSDNSDPAVLEWCAREDRVLFTHDVNTMVKHAYNRIKSNKSLPGLIGVQQKCPIGQAIEDLSLLIKYLTSEEYKNRIIYIPLA